MMQMWNFQRGGLGQDKPKPLLREVMDVSGAAHSGLGHFFCSWARHFILIVPLCRAAIKFLFTCSLDLHRRSKLITLWVNCINYMYRPVHP